ncbi:MAG: hypothetical protein KKC28_01470 [Verrucomicrobia bacterium]|nr:hypothetical protein [Verrucomicrobiota bacterium]MBU1855635.1 hypothetical protein [Verrucomicrobiota bacterium]
MRKHGNGADEPKSPPPFSNEIRAAIHDDRQRRSRADITRNPFCPIRNTSAWHKSINRVSAPSRQVRTAK